MNLTLCVALELLGCATAYQPHGFKGGYYDQKIDDNTAEVSFVATDSLRPKPFTVICFDDTP